MLFLDLQKAFDTVDHQVVLLKLTSYGICNKSLTWTESYLHSPSLLLTCGVPHGSILGPLLLTIYVNGLLKCKPHGTSYLYADDTAIAVSNTNPLALEARLNETLRQLSA